jgi:hypothetical protein
VLSPSASVRRSVPTSSRRRGVRVSAERGRAPRQRKEANQQECVESVSQERVESLLESRSEDGLTWTRATVIPRRSDRQRPE